MMAQSGSVPDVVSFGPFRLHRRQRLLKRDGEAVKLGSRAFDVLLALIDNAGEVVSRDALLARAWPDTFVEEVSPRVQVAALRKALENSENGSRYLTTIPGRGYCTVSGVRIPTD
jgi:DNA-binding winged helix-turn-helix (wHTH) protein